MLSQEISLLKAGVAHDLMLIRNGEQGDEYQHLKYVCLDKLSPKYNLVKVLMQNINAMEAEPPRNGRPPKKEADEPEEKITLPIAGELEEKPLPLKGNAFERISMEVVNGSQRG